MKISRLLLLTILSFMVAPLSVRAAPPGAATAGRPEVPSVRPLRQRPELSGPELYRSKTHVLVHYTTSGRDSTAPAFAESVAVYSESAWVRIARFGWAMPAPDQGYGGDDRMDIYVRSVGIVAGSCPDSAYSNPYPDGVSCYHQYNCSLAMNEWLKWVGTHETHHSAQARYAGNLGRWSYENTSNYVVRKVFPDCWEVYDWSFDAVSPLSTPWLSINHSPTSDNYVGAGALFWVFLDEYYGEDAPRRIWDLMGRHAGEHTFRDFDSVLRTDYESSLAAALGHYAIWRYFTGARDDGLHFALAESLRNCVVHARHTTFPASGDQGSHGPRGPAGVCPIEFVNSSSQDLIITFDGQVRHDWRVYVLAIRGGEVHEQLMDLDAANSGELRIPVALAQTAVLLPVVVETAGDSDSTAALQFDYSASLADEKVLGLEAPGTAVLLGQRGANPVAGSVPFVVTLGTGVPGRLALIDATGREVRDYRVAGTGRPETVTWDLTDRSGMRVASGIYCCQLSGAGGIVQRKLIVK